MDYLAGLVVGQRFLALLAPVILQALPHPKETMVEQAQPHQIVGLVAGVELPQLVEMVMEAMEV